MLSTGSNENQARSHSRLLYLPALDGLRAIAVIAVLLYHAELPAFKGGFLGVDVFFVISGYLITSLLLGEWNQTGNIDLRAFWMRRARRLLPALFLLLSVVLIFSVYFLQDEVARLRSDAIAAFGYVTNWYLIFIEQSYFQAAGRPSLFQHLWSLAVEEQFYVLWPLLFVFLMKFARRFALPIVIGGVMASSLLMGVLYTPDMDPSRVYYGTDTRAAGLLVGVALAMLLGSISSANKPSPVIAWVREATCGVALAVLLIFFVMVDESDPFLYQGGFLLLEIAVAVLIASIVLPGARLLPSLIGSSLPRWLGLRSYGIYLWHWPVFMLTRPRVDVELDGLPLLLLRLAITLVLAELSYRFVETPIRRGALQRVWRDLRIPTKRRANLLNVRFAATLVTLLVLAATIGPPIVSARLPAPPDYLSQESINMVDPGLDIDNAPDNIEDSFETATTIPATPTATSTSAPKIEITTTVTVAKVELPTVEAVETSAATSTTIATATGEAVPTATQIETVQPSETATAMSEEPTSTPFPTETATEIASNTPVITEEPTLLPTETVAPRILTDDDARFTPTTVPDSLPPETPETNPTITESSATPGVTLIPGDVQSLGKIVAIGDSVMLGAVKELTRVIPNIAVDAKVSRQESATISLLDTYKKNGLLGQVVVIHIGNNGTITTKQFDQIMSVLTDTKWVVFVNLSVPRKWEAPNNAVLSEGVARYSNAVLVDWHAASVSQRDYFANDGYHLQITGQKVYAALILEKLLALIPPGDATPTTTPILTTAP